MAKLINTSITMLIVGVITVLVAVFTWPRSYLSTPDPTANILGISIGGTLATMGLLGIMLYLHARAVGDAIEEAQALREWRQR